MPGPRNGPCTTLHVKRSERELVPVAVKGERRLWCALAAIEPHVPGGPFHFSATPSRQRVAAVSRTKAITLQWLRRPNYKRRSCVETSCSS